LLALRFVLCCAVLLCAAPPFHCATDNNAWKTLVSTLNPSHSNISKNGIDIDRIAVALNILVVAVIAAKSKKSRIDTSINLQNVSNWFPYLASVYDPTSRRNLRSITAQSKPKCWISPSLRGSWSWCCPSASSAGFRDPEISAPGYDDCEHNGHDIYTIYLSPATDNTIRFEQRFSNHRRLVVISRSSRCPPVSVSSGALSHQI
jgi:hypothetical protein